MSAFKEVPRGYLSSFCGVHAPIAAPLIIIPRWSQSSRKSHVRVARGSYRATTTGQKAQQLRSAIIQSADGLIAYHVVTPIGILRSFPSSDWKRERIVRCVTAPSPPPRFNCKLKRALALPLRGLLISIRTSCYDAMHGMSGMYGVEWTYALCCGVEKFLVERF